MSATRLNVLVYGGTGSQARPVVSKLIERGHHPYVLTRTREKAADLEAAGASIVIGDLRDPASLQAASAGMDAVALLIPNFLEQPAEAGTYARNVIDAAQAAGVGLIVWNTSGPLPEAPTGHPLEDMHLGVLDYLRKTGIAHTLIEPTTYMENWLGPWTAPTVATQNQVAWPLLEERKMGWITSEDVGALVVAALERPELAGRRFKVSGIEAPTGSELAEQFSLGLGRSITYYAMTPEEMGAVIDQLFGPGAGAPIVQRYREERENPNLRPSYYDMRPVLEQLPVQMTTIKEWVARHAQAFSPAQ